MKGHRVYLFIVLLALTVTFVSSGCARKSGCHDIELTTKVPKKPKKAKTHLFDKKTRRKM